MKVRQPVNPESLHSWFTATNVVRLLVGCVAASLLIPVGRSASFVVPPDQVLIREANTIVVGTVLSSYGRWSDAGGIETVSELSVDEVIKGQVDRRQPLRIVELGGEAGGMGLAICGGADYRPGQKVLALVDPRADGRWQTLDMILGKFDFFTDDRGTPLIRRGEGDSIFGWDLQGQRWTEHARDGAKFLRFVREVAAGESPSADYFAPVTVKLQASARRRVRPVVAVGGAYPAWTYDMRSASRAPHTGGEARWNGFPSTVLFENSGTLAGAPNGGVDAIKAGTAAWTNDPDSNVDYGYGGTTTSRKGLKTYDEINSVLFEDPNSEISGSWIGYGTLAVGGPWFSTQQTHQWAGDTFATTFNADIVLQNGLSTWAGIHDSRMNQLITHELGHTLGFRHSDQGQLSTEQCPETFDCTENAVMVATLDVVFGTTLQPWDRRAVAALYGNGVVSEPFCIGIGDQPNSMLIPVGGSATLDVSASANSTVTWQWYRGERGNTSSPIAGANSSQLRIGPLFQDQRYWARATTGCGTADSAAAWVRVGELRRRHGAR